MSEIAEVIKHGIVSSIDPANCTARVIFSDRDDVVSYDLPILQQNVGAAKFYTMPSVGQNVVCVFMGTGLEDGFIIGSFYNAESAPPTNNAALHIIQFDDGGSIAYSGGKFTLIGDLNVDGNVNASGDVIAGTISLKTHITKGVQPGSGLSGEPQ